MRHTQGVTGPGYGGSPLEAVALRAAGIAVVFAFLPAGCFFHLDDPVPAGASGGASGEASGGDPGAGGAPSGGASGGSLSGGTSAGGGSGAAAAGGAANCPPGKVKHCGTACVSIDDPAYGCSPNDNECTKCVQIDTANTSCSSGKCVVDGCKDGFGDCDADDSNGCEIEFATLPQTYDSSVPIDAARTSSPTDMDINGLATEPVWTATAARRRRLNDLCIKCSPQSPIPGVVDSARPKSTDLDAWVRTAWDDFSFYAFLEVRDDQFPPPAESQPGSDLDKLGPAVVEDAVELLISLDKGGFGVDDMQIFYGIDGKVQRPNQSVGPPEKPSRSAVKKGRGCYSIEVELRFEYMTQNKTFMPMQGQMLGFTAAVDDWDYVEQADGGRTPERQHHIFTKDMPDQYWFNPSSFGLLTLSGP